MIKKSKHGPSSYRELQMVGLRQNGNCAEWTYEGRTKVKA